VKVRRDQLTNDGLTNGAGTLLVSSLKAGKYQMQAQYLTTQNYAASVSPGLLHTVKGGK
jgi:hypothetical protein